MCKKCLLESKQAMKKAKASFVEFCCLHTYLHTADNCLLSQVNIEVFISIFTHNPLVPGSSPGGPTTLKGYILKTLFTVCTDHIASTLFARR